MLEGPALYATVLVGVLTVLLFAKLVLLPGKPAKFLDKSRQQVRLAKIFNVRSLLGCVSASFR